MRHYLKIVLAMLIWSTWGPLIRWMALPPVVVLFYTSLSAGFIVPAVLRMAATARSIDCNSASDADRVCDCGEGVQWPKERKPIFFMERV